MATRDPRIDAYIAKSAEFAKPILEHLRAVVHAACPDVEETMKWSMPHFDYRGEMMCAMSAFKAHAAFGFWKGALVLGANAQSRDAMGSFGRITSVKELPAKRVLVGYVRKAMALNDAGIKVARPKKHPKAAVVMPADLKAALMKSKRAWAQWQAFSPGRRREYLVWVLEAKQDATRARRISAIVSQVAEGKSQNWKYERTR
ncbi:MAG: YdeI/OmpD-associated family protein [Gemmatimonadaceae bacterium]|jgi:uncharacterized protein YdeI (YjbR/CyaY-like superfamily)